MSAIRSLGGVRLLRPLLGTAKAELLGLLKARGQPWIEDPSNSNPAFERVRLRAAAGTTTDEQAVATLHRLGLERKRIEEAAAAILATSLTLQASGWAELDLAGFAETASPCGLAFGWILQSLGGNDYPVAEGRRLEALERIRMDSAADFTLGGCHLRRRGAILEIYRDWGAIRDRLAAQPGMRAVWDDRFAVTVAPQLPASLDFKIARLGEAGLRQLGQVGHDQAAFGVPEPARKALPALWQGDRLAAVPHLGLGNGLEARFRPARPVTSGGFTVA